jgi:hypothetical protein
VTQVDRALQDRVNQFQTERGGPKITHLIGGEGGVRPPEANRRIY